MKKLILFPILALLIMALISCEKDQVEPITSLDSQEEMATTRANATVPFKGEFDNTIDGSQTTVDGEGNLHEYITGIGKATHLGKCTIFGPTTVYAVFVEEPILPFVQVGSFTFVAADESTFIVDYSGTTSPGTPPVFFAGDGMYDIREGSGTGRFEGTTGAGEYSYVATQDPETEEVTSVLQFIGTLTNP